MSVKQLFASYGVTGRLKGNEIEAACPFCGKDKHFYLHVESGLYDCKVCGKRGNPRTFLREFARVTRGEENDILRSFGLLNGSRRRPKKEKESKALDASRLNAYQIETARLNAFAQERGLPVSLLKKHQLGWDGHAYTLPVWTPEGKLTDIRRREPGKKEVSIKGGKLGIFALQNLLDNETVYVAEGCCDAMMLESKGFPAIGIPGAGHLPASHAKLFKGKTAVFVYDADDAGRKGVVTDAKKIHACAREIKSVDLTPLANGQEGYDISDFFNEGGTTEKFKELVAQAQNVEPENYIEDAPTVAEALTRICEREIVEFVHDNYGGYHVVLPFGNHNELWPTSSGKFRQWLANKYRGMTGKPPGNEAIRQAKLQVDGMCSQQERRRLHNRVAFVDGKLYYDLTNDSWQAIQVTKEGWRVVQLPPVFKRYKQQAAQVIPVQDGDARWLLDFLNVSEQDECLLMVTVASWFIPDIPHPVLVFHGEQGAAKSSTCRLLKRLVDPVGPLTSPESPSTLAIPKEQRELVQQLDHNWVALYDNVSHLPTWASDCLCRAVTGEGMSVRALYTDDEDFIRGYRRCIGVTGINNPVLRGDLLDRSILIELRPIGTAERKDERTLHQEFEKALPGILGGFLNALAGTLQGRDSAPRENLQRMADFDLWGRVLAPPLGFPSSQFINDYAGAIDEKWHDAVESDTFAQEIISLVDGSLDKVWTGTATDLFNAVCKNNENASERKSKGLPANARGASAELKRIAPALRQVGVHIDLTGKDPKTRRRRIVIRRN